MIKRVTEGTWSGLSERRQTNRFPRKIVHASPLILSANTPNDDLETRSDVSVSRKCEESIPSWKLLLWRELSEPYSVLPPTPKLLIP